MKPTQPPPPSGQAEPRPIREEFPPVEEATFHQLMEDAWDQDWQVSFLGIGTPDAPGWEVSIINLVTNRRIGYVLADEVTGNTPLEALRAAVAIARDRDKPRWHDDGTPYGKWLYPGDEGYHVDVLN